MGKIDRLLRKARLDERRKIKKQVAKLKREINKTVFDISNLGISKSAKSQINIRRAAFAKKRLKLLVNKFNRFAKQFGV